jgi:hypothetical protein
VFFKKTQHKLQKQNDYNRNPFFFYLNHICLLLEFLESHPNLHVSRIRVNPYPKFQKINNLASFKNVLVMSEKFSTNQMKLNYIIAKEASVLMCGYSVTITVTARYKAWMCGSLLAGIVGSNPAGGMNFY